MLENGERKFVILKRHEAEIINAVQKCNTNCNLVFSSEGMLDRIEPDTLQESDDGEGDLDDEHISIYFLDDTLHVRCGLISGGLTE